MSLLYYGTKPDRRAGIVVVAVFALGIFGASLATIMNGGDLPQATSSYLHLTKITAPL